MIPAHIARLNSDGSTDESFIPYLNGGVSTISVLSGNLFFVGGGFTQASGLVRPNAVVLDQTGEPFSPNLEVNGNVYSSAAQVNGSVIFGGSFSSVSGQSRIRLARLNSELTLDPVFVSNRSSSTSAISLNEDGQVWVGNVSTPLSRLKNNPAISNITIQSATQILWEVSGSFPESSHTALYSRDTGDPDWTFQAYGAQVVGGWQFTGISLGDEGDFLIEVYSQGSSSMSLQTATGAYLFEPVMQVQGQDGSILVSGSIIDYGNAQNGSTIPRTFIILNNGLEDLDITLPTVLSGANANQYEITEQPAATVPPGGQTSFTLSFKPNTVANNKVAVFTITSNDSVSPSFTLSLTGNSLAGPGSRDNTFQPIANDAIYSASINEIGSILVGGLFTSLNSATRNRVGKLLASGANDPTFTGSGIGASQGVYCTACDLDGATFVGGYFTAYNGATRRRLVKISPTGAVDSGFNPNINNTVYSICIQSDGKILLAGVFDTINGVTTGGLARLNANGTLDSTFINPIASAFSHRVCLQLPDGKILSAYSNSVVRLLPSGAVDTSFGVSGYVSGNNTVQSLIVDYQNRIYVGGNFSTFSGVTRGGLVRLNADGSVDSTFANASYGLVTTCVPQTDGKIIVGFNGTLSRRNEDGTDDTTFADTLSGGIVSGIVPQKNGMPIIVGQFTIDGIANTRIARLRNDTVPGNVNEPNIIDALSVLPDGTVQWQRGGVSPEANLVTFESSQDGGSTWFKLGSAIRSSGGWTLSGASVPASGKMRGSAKIRGGRYNGSSSLIQTITDYSGVNAPDISIQQPANTFLNPTGSTVSFPGRQTGQFSELNFIVTNTGNAPISGLIATTTSPDFSVASNPPSSLSLGSQATFTIRFTPSAIGARSGSLLVVSNVPGIRSQYTIALQGNGITTPLATTQTAQSVTATTAVLRGLVTARDDSAAVSFRYRVGSAGSWINVAAVPSSVSGFTATAVTAPLTGLITATTYQYQVQISNTIRPSSNPVYGAIVSFTTT